jgi:hypothetical protein
MMSGKKKPLPLFLGVKAEWVEKPGNAQPCTMCEDPIFGNRYEHETTIFSKKKITAGPLCASCYQLVKDDENFRQIQE